MATIRPGEWICPECEYVYVNRTASALTGAMKANREPAHQCPNDGQDLRPLTQEEVDAEIARIRPARANVAPAIASAIGVGASLYDPTDFGSW